MEDGSRLRSDPINFCYRSRQRHWSRKLSLLFNTFVKFSGSTCMDLDKTNLTLTLTLIVFWLIMSLLINKTNKQKKNSKYTKYQDPKVKYSITMSFSHLRRDYKLHERLTGPWQEAEPLRGRHSAWQATHKDPSAYSRTDLQHKHSREVRKHHIAQSGICWMLLSEAPDAVIF